MYSLAIFYILSSYDFEKFYIPERDGRSLWNWDVEWEGTCRAATYPAIRTLAVYLIGSPALLQAITLFFIKLPLL